MNLKDAEGRSSQLSIKIKSASLSNYIVVCYYKVNIRENNQDWN